MQELLRPRPSSGHAHPDLLTREVGMCRGRPLWTPRVFLVTEQGYDSPGLPGLPSLRRFSYNFRNLSLSLSSSDLVLKTTELESTHGCRFFLSTGWISLPFPLPLSLLLFQNQSWNKPPSFPRVEFLPKFSG